MIHKIGFMQGRLSPQVNSRIQAFPWEYWRIEFAVAQKANFHLMEWTLDQESLYENPLLTIEGQEEIKKLCETYKINIPSLTGDCFMQDPLWKSKGKKHKALEIDFIEIIKGCVATGINLIVIPLVDNGKLENMKQENNLVAFLESQANFISMHNVRIAFESDYEAFELSRFIDRLDPALFGINYDIGNSAALGFNAQIEFSAYGSRIINVHVKDRVLGGSTVALGKGDANFDMIFNELTKINYQGNFILQTARAINNNHSEVLIKYRDLTLEWLKRHAI